MSTRSTRRPRRTRTTVVSLAVAVAIMAAGVASSSLLADSDPSAGAQPSATTAPTDAAANPAADAQPVAAPGAADPAKPITLGEPGSALAVLDTLTVKGKAAKTGYDREGEYGPAWTDIDSNGCDTRNDILTRDLTDIVTDEDCTVLSGILLDPYTGKRIEFVHSSSAWSPVHIDHVVALANTWVTGAQLLTPEQRVSLANDPINLIAVDGQANLKKGAGDAATWLPPAKSSRCAYVARQISVKAAYSLWVAPAEKEAMERVLDTCPEQAALPTADGALVAGLAPVQ